MIMGGQNCNCIVLIMHVVFECAAKRKMFFNVIKYVLSMYVMQHIRIHLANHELISNLTFFPELVLLIFFRLKFFDFCDTHFSIMNNLQQSNTNYVGNNKLFNINCYEKKFTGNIKLETHLFSC